MEISELIQTSLDEDIKNNDVTSSLLIDSNLNATAHIIAKEPGVFFGSPIIESMDALIDSISINAMVIDGAHLNKSDVCVSLTGNLKTILECERTLLNFLQRLSGISTITDSFVSALNNPKIKILDTRKTTPLFRDLEKKAVVAGGGYNHRFGLYDMILVKENHLKYFLDSGNFEQFNTLLTQHKINFPDVSIEVEVDSIDLLKKLNLNSIDIILFDNMNLNMLSDCLDFISSQSKKILTEVSGNINLETIKFYQNIDINRISIGSLTHSVKALDLSLLVL